MNYDEQSPLIKYRFQVDEESLISCSYSSTHSYNNSNCSSSTYTSAIPLDKMPSPSNRNNSVCESTFSSSSNESSIHSAVSLSPMQQKNAPQSVMESNPETETHPMVNDPAPPPIMTINNQSHLKTLKLLPLAILVFYNVSGGPFGIEPALHSAGNFYTILGFIIVPFIWSVPEALITAELGSIFCHDSSGGVAWVDEAFGESWGLICGYLGWVAGATDNAIYPTLFLHYLISVFQTQQQQTGKDDIFDELYDNNFMRFMFVSILSIALAYVNYRGLEIVGNASIVVCVIAMSPFVIMSIIGLPQMEPSRWFQLPDPNITQCQDGYYYNDDVNNDEGGDESFSSVVTSWFQTLLGMKLSQGVLWTPFINNLFWNLNSFDSASSFAGEVQSVSTTYPRGIFLGLFLCIILYLIPLLAITGATDYTQCEWTDGQLGKAAIDIGGNWLGGWIVFAAGISNLALFEAELSADSYQLMGMAERGHLPKIFAKRSERFGTPIVGIGACTLVIILMSVADFTQLVELLNFNYSIALLLEYLAFAKLRWARKDLERPYRIPVPDWAAILLVIPPILGLFVLFAIATWVTYAFVVFVCVLGLVFYYFQELAKKRNWCSFIDVPSKTRQGYDQDSLILSTNNNKNREMEEVEASVWDYDNDDSNALVNNGGII